MKNLPHKNGYPGEGYHYVLCDICGFKIRAKDATLINDKYNLSNQLLVCSKDADQTNPQDHLKTRRERQISNPKLIRSEGTDTFGFIGTPSEIETGDVSNAAGRTSSAPLNIELFEVSSSQIILLWSPPASPGSSPIEGYKIEREVSGMGYSTLNANTKSGAAYYQDTLVTPSTNYNYKITAINRDGEGDTSEAFNITSSA